MTDAEIIKHCTKGIRTDELAALVPKGHGHLTVFRAIQLGAKINSFHKVHDLAGIKYRGFLKIVK